MQGGALQMRDGPWRKLTIRRRTWWAPWHVPSRIAKSNSPAVDNVVRAGAVCSQEVHTRVRPQGNVSDARCDRSSSTTAGSVRIVAEVTD
jgi:hypothetical protein